MQSQTTTFLATQVLKAPYVILNISLREIVIILFVHVILLQNKRRYHSFDSLCLDSFFLNSFYATENITGVVSKIVQ